MNHHDAAQPEEPAEHLRFRDYLSRLEQVTESAEADLVGEVLSDPDQVMAQSAVVRHLDRRAGELHLGPAYESWAGRMAEAVTGCPLSVRRLNEWAFVRAVRLSRPWCPDDLVASSDWLQLRVTEAADAAALEILAVHGRTKRIRNAARANLRQQSRG